MQFKIDSGVRQGRVISPWFFNVYMNVVMIEVKKEDWKNKSEFSEKGREQRLTVSVNNDDLVLWSTGREYESYDKKYKGVSR